MTFTKNDTETGAAFRPTHRLTVPVTQGVQGPARPAVTFAAGTPVAIHAAWGDLAYADTADGWTLVIRISEEVAPILEAVR